MPAKGPFYEFNILDVERTRIRSASKVPAADVVIEMKSRLQEARAISLLHAVVSTKDKEVMSGNMS